MSVLIFFLRHARTQVNTEIHASMWNLSTQGKEDMQEEITQEKFHDIQQIYCSNEPKTIQTIQKFAQTQHIPLDTHVGFGEIHFAEFQDDIHKFLSMKKECFQHLDEQKYGDESYRDGLQRFMSTLTQLKAENPGKNLLIVSHGTVLSLYFAAMHGRLNDGLDIYQKWQKLRFLAWGCIDDGKVVRDLF